MVFGDPRSISIQEGSTKADDQRVVRFPSTALADPRLPSFSLPLSFVGWLSDRFVPVGAPELTVTTACMDVVVPMELVTLTQKTLTLSAHTRASALYVVPLTPQ